ncbi:MAG: BadF/BadG/BcrA/BcrD ATPase family protein [Longimicrobiales bacterium]
MTYYLGVDGGGTRTRAVVLDREGVEKGRAEGAAALADARHPERAAEALRDVCFAALGAADSAAPARAVWAGVAGAGREAARSAVELELSRFGVADVCRVGTDVVAAFHDAFPSGPGILLIAGTGSIAWGRAESGREGRVGGWGHHIGDEGSGYAIGREALRRVARHADGRAPETALREALLDELGLETVDRLVQWAADATKAQVAALAPVVARSSDQGDPVAGEILVHAVEELEGHVATVLARLGPWSQPPSVALGGGLLRPGRPLRAAMERVLERMGLAARAGEPDAARGAARLALEIPDPGASTGLELPPGW